MNQQHPDALQEDRLHAQLEAAGWGERVTLEILQTVDSTNSHLLRALAAGSPPELYHICLAESQSAGRGRSGRHWVSPFGANIYASVACPFDTLNLSGLSLAVGVAILHALDALGFEGIGVKWPNDIYWQQQKLGGVLIDVRPAGDSVSAVIGVGLNYRMPREYAPGIDQAFTDLATLLPAALPARNEVAAALIHHLLLAASRFRSEGFAPFREAWSQRHVFHGREVRLLRDHDEIRGVVTGINAEGLLGVRDASGRERYHASGDVSLRAGA